MLGSEPDELLVAQAKADPYVFGLIYQRYLGRIYNYMYHRTGSIQDAEDLTEKTFLQAFNHIDRYQDKGVPFAAWLFRIAHNLMANWHRDNHRHRFFRLDVLVPLEDCKADPTIRIETQEEQAELRTVIARLPRDRQQLLLLKFVEGMPNSEIAAIMGRTEGAVKALLHRTLISLKRDLERSRKENV